MKKLWISSAMALIGLFTLLPMTASAAPPRFVIRGGVYLGGPAYWGPYWGYGPAYYYGPAIAPTVGEVKIHTPIQDAQVFVDGGYAGTTHKLTLAEGTHQIAVQDPQGDTLLNTQVNVIPGQTVNLNVAS